MNLALPELARQNYAALCTLSSFFVRRGYWPKERPMNREVACTVLHLFEVLAWADQRLHINECWLMDALLEEDINHGGELQAQIALGRIPDAKHRVPGALAAAALHDSVHGTRFSELVIKHLENLASLIVMADSHIDSSERSQLESYFAYLRQAVAATEAIQH